MRLLVPCLLALLVVGCGSPAKTSPTEPVVEAKPPKNIGDGSPIVFTQWKDIRKGTGGLTDAKGPKTIVAIDLEMKPDHSLKLALFEDGSKAPGYTYEGKWTRRDGKVVEFVLNKGAKGEIHFMDQANPSILTFRGRDGNGKPLIMDFRVQE